MGGGRLDRDDGGDAPTSNSLRPRPCAWKWTLHSKVNGFMRLAPDPAEEYVGQRLDAPGMEGNRQLALGPVVVHRARPAARPRGPDRQESESPRRDRTASGPSPLPPPAHTPGRGFGDTAPDCARQRECAPPPACRSPRRGRTSMGRRPNRVSGRWCRCSTRRPRSLSGQIVPTDNAKIASGTIWKERRTFGAGGLPTMSFHEYKRL